jgi:16S rRNA (adenine1518-N6/adenine1519-N6)-dimethyltransferase
MFLNKALGQHFLIHQGIAQMIAQSFFEKSSDVIEIGPGHGAITQYLTKKNLILIEKDLRFIDILKKYSKKIYQEDFFDCDFLQFQHLKNLWVVSNLPYNVGTRIFVDLCQYRFIEYMTLMFQKEVGEKFLETKMSLLKVLAMNLFHIRKLCSVSAESFKPAPKVDSIVILFEKKQESISEYQPWIRFLKNLFLFPRKQLKNRFPSELVGTARAEDLSFETIVQLFQAR